MAQDGPEPFVSTGRLPVAVDVERWVAEAHERFRAVDDGAPSRVYPALADVPAGLFGLCVVATTGRVVAAGDAEHPFTLMSVAKPFVFALVCARLGDAELRRRVGANATGLPFNSLAAVERTEGITNPMVNAGAIVTTSLAPGATTDERWAWLRDGLSRMAGRKLPLDEAVLASARATNARNQAIARLLRASAG